MRKGFSLLEILIVITIVLILAAALLVTLNPWEQTNKAHDVKRKTELTQLSKALEDFYNDHQCYPKANQVCFNAPTQRADGSFICNMCGTDPASPSLSPQKAKSKPMK